MSSTKGSRSSDYLETKQHRPLQNLI